MNLLLRLIVFAVVGLLLNTVAAAIIYCAGPLVESAGPSSACAPESAPALIDILSISNSNAVHWEGRCFGRATDTFGTVSGGRVLAEVHYIGWPWFAFQGAQLYSPATKVGAIVPPQFLQDVGLAREWIPIRPFIPGTLLNAAAYGLLAYLAFLVAREMRSRSRRRRGLCSHCAYPVLDLGHCPECGMRTRQRKPEPV